MGNKSYLTYEDVTDRVRSDLWQLSAQIYLV